MRGKTKSGGKIGDFENFFFFLFNWGSIVLFKYFFYLLPCLSKPYKLKKLLTYKDFKKYIIQTTIEGGPHFIFSPWVPNLLSPPLALLLKC